MELRLLQAKSTSRLNTASATSLPPLYGTLTTASGFRPSVRSSCGARFCTVAAGVAVVQLAGLAFTAFARSSSVL